MNALRQFLVIVRPIQCLTAAFAVIAIGWIAARHMPPNTPTIAAAISMALLVFASSAYHCAFQKHDQPFTRRVHDYLPERHSWVLASLASAAFLVAIGLLVAYLPLLATYATLVTGGLVVLYTKYRGINAPLNTLVAAMCMTPVFTGWLASGVPLSGTAYSLMGFAFVFYYVREVVKDAQESAKICERCEQYNSAHEDLDWGGTSYGIWGLAFVATIATGCHLIGNTDLPHYAVVLAFSAVGVLAFALAMRESRKLHPQRVMTAYVWVYLSLWLMMTPGA